MAWLTPEEFISIYVTETAQQPPQSVADSLQSAIDEIEYYVGETMIQEIAAASDLSLLKVRVLRDAQKKLTLREQLLQFWARVKDGGIVDTERDENSVTTNKYTSFADIEKRRESLKKEAMEIIERYVPLTASEKIFPEEDYTHSVDICSSW